MSNPSNPLSAEQLDACEAELRAALPDLYPDPGEREIVERVIIPQLRVVVRTTLAPVTLPLSPKEIDALCTNVDRAIDNHKTLLDTDGLLRPAMPKITEVRQRVRAELVENFKAVCRAALAEHKVYDRTALLYRGTNWFRKCNFLPFGMGLVFAHKILGESVRGRNYEMLEEIAEQLNLPIHSEEQARVYREALAVHGIIDRSTLIHTTSLDFRKMNFPPWRGVFAFFSEILGETICRTSIVLRHRIADVVGFRRVTPDEEKAAYRAALAIHGIDDRGTLYANGVMYYYRGTNFPPYGKGSRFFAKILAERYVRPSFRVLVRVADVLDLPLISETKKQEYRALLATHNIHDRVILMQMRPKAFVKAKFGPYGKGTAFAGRILGRVIEVVTRPILNEIADALGW